MSAKFWIFKRSANNFKEFGSARKSHVGWAKTTAQAVKICDEYNENRTGAQIKRGTKYEFTSQF